MEKIKRMHSQPILTKLFRNMNEGFPSENPVGGSSDSFACSAEKVWSLP